MRNFPPLLGTLLNTVPRWNKSGYDVIVVFSTEISLSLYRVNIRDFHYIDYEHFLK